MAKGFVFTLAKLAKVVFAIGGSQYDDDERGAHSEKNARCGHTGEKKKRAAKPKVERCMYIKERYDKGGAESRQRNKQGRMEEEDHQLYQMTGQGRDEEEEEEETKIRQYLISTALLNFISEARLTNADLILDVL